FNCCCFYHLRQELRSTLFPYTTLFRSGVSHLVFVYFSIELSLNSLVRWTTPLPKEVVPAIVTSVKSSRAPVNTSEALAEPSLIKMYTSSNDSAFGFFSFSVSISC